MPVPVLLVGEALPSVLAVPLPPPLGCGGMALNTVVLAAMIAWRNGCTPNEMLAMIAIPASTPTSRSQPTLTGRTVRGDRTGFGMGSSPCRGSRRSRGNPNCGSRGHVTCDSCGHATCGSRNCGSRCNGNWGN